MNGYFYHRRSSPSTLLRKQGQEESMDKARYRGLTAARNASTYATVAPVLGRLPKPRALWISNGSID